MCSGRATAEDEHWNEMGNIVLVSDLRHVFAPFMYPALVEQLPLVSVEVAPKLLEENCFVLIGTFGGSPEIRLGRL